MPERIARLPKKGGWPVPWFVDKVDGEFDFRVMDGRKLVLAIKQKLCWVCGEKLGKFQSFVIGPMCGVTRTNGEPPSHRECAEYSARHCPFLTRPNMKRREDEITEAGTMAGVGLKRNPGCCAVWTTTSYKLFKPPGGGVLFTIGDPVEVNWFAEGRAATRAEVQASIHSGIHLLRDACNKEATPERCAAAHEELDEALARLKPLLPKEEEQPALTEEQISIMDHTVHRAAGGRYCGGGKDMDRLVELGYMQYIGTPAWADDPFYSITSKGREALRAAGGGEA